MRPHHPPPPRHLDVGSWRLQLVAARYPSRCNFCGWDIPPKRLCYLGHGVPFCLRCALRPSTQLLIGEQLREVLWVLDLATQEGAAFDLARPLPAQLERHQIWVCILYEPLLAWLEKQRPLDLAQLPALVVLPETPFEKTSHRHGDWIAQLPQEALRFLAHPLVDPQLPASLRRLLRKILPAVGVAYAGASR